MVANRVVVVIGAGRSGTSLAMQILAAQGMCVSGLRKDLDTSNMQGDFEDQAITAIHSEMASVLDISPFYPRDITRLDVRKILPQLQSLKALVKENLSQCGGVWGFKDPRTSTLLPLWEIVLKELDIQPCYVLCVRSPGAVVASMKTHFNRVEHASESLWLSRNCEPIVHCGTNMFVVHYEDWFDNPERAVKQAKELLEYVSLPIKGVEISLAKLVKPNLNRSPSAYLPVNPMIARLYDLLRDLPDRAAISDEVIRNAREFKTIADFYWDVFSQQMGTTVPRKFARQAEEQKRLLEEKISELEKDRSDLRKLAADCDAAKTKLVADNEGAKARLIMCADEEKAKLVADGEAAKAEYEKVISAMEARVEHALEDAKILTMQNNAYLKQLKEMHDRSEGLAIKLHAIPRQPCKPEPPRAAKPTAVNAAGKATPIREAKGATKKSKALVDPSARRRKLWKKFKRDPGQFFADSRVTLFRPMRHLFKNRA